MDTFQKGSCVSLLQKQQRQKDAPRHFDVFPVDNEQTRSLEARFDLPRIQWLLQLHLAELFLMQHMLKTGSNIAILSCISTAGKCLPIMYPWMHIASHANAKLPQYMLCYGYCIDRHTDR